MRTFDTPEPISITVGLGVGDIRIAASDRADTAVDVRPSDPAKKADVSAAQQTKVEYAGGRLDIRAPKPWRKWTPWGGHGSVDVRIDVPAGSTLSGESSVGSLSCSGRIGSCRFRIGVGDIRVEEAGPIELVTGAGDIDVDAVERGAEVKTGSGAVRIRSVDGTAVVRNGNGETWLGEVTGDARVSAANGNISVDVAREGAVAKTANGNVRLGDVERGTVVAQSAFGAIEVGVREGVAAWLDLDTKFGHVKNDLDVADRPGRGEDAVEVHASTSYGDISVRRSFAHKSHAERG
jgi:Putative adhesin